MSIRVKIEYEETKKTSYAWVENGIVCLKGEKQTPSDMKNMKATIITSNVEIVEQLQKNNYNVKKSNVQATYKRKKNITRLPYDAKKSLIEDFAEKCALNNEQSPTTTINRLMKEYIQK